MELSTTDSTFKDTVQQWLNSHAELFVVIRYPYAAGAIDYRFVARASDFQELINTLLPRTSVIIMSEKQLCIRGSVDDKLINESMQYIPVTAEFLIVRLEQETIGRPYSGGQGHAEMLIELRERYGENIAIGSWPEWERDSSTVIEGIVPDEDGIARRGIY